MPKKPKKTPQQKPREKPLSLYPMSLEDALKKLLNTKPQDKKGQEKIKKGE